MVRLYNIVHVVGKLNRGGAETMLINVQKKLPDHISFDYLVHGADIGDYEEEVLKMGSLVYRLENFRLINYFKYRNQVEKFVKKLPLNTILHIHIRSVSALFVSVAEKHGIPVIVHSHSTSNGRGLKALLTDYLQYSGNNPKVGNLACGKKAGLWMFGKNDFDIFYNKIELRDFFYSPLNSNNLRKHYELRDCFIIGQVGNLTYAKNHDFTIRLAFEFKKHNIEDVKFLLIGLNTDGPILKEKISQYGLEKYFLLEGAKKNINHYYSVFDCLIHPSLYEGFPMVLIEAQANGLHCFISDTITKESVVLKNRISILELDTQIWFDRINLFKEKRKNRSRALTLEEKRCFQMYDANKAPMELEKIYSRFLETGHSERVNNK